MFRSHISSTTAAIFVFLSNFLSCSQYFTLYFRPNPGPDRRKSATVTDRSEVVGNADCTRAKHAQKCAQLAGNLNEWLRVSAMKHVFTTKLTSVLDLKGCDGYKEG